MQIITAAERMNAPRGTTAVIVGPSGVGKTSLLRTVDPATALFINIEAGDLSVQDVAVDQVCPVDWTACRDIACLIGGPNPSYPPHAAYSQAHYDALGGTPDALSKYPLIFVDSITAASRLSFRWCEQQPEAISSTGKKDTRGAYGLHGREMMAWLNQLQHARGKSIIFVGILEKVADEFNRDSWQIQIEGGKTGRELPGIVDEVITYQFIDFGDGKPTRAFVCTSPNQWGYPAKDRSGRLDPIEKPDLGALITKLTTATAK